MPNIDYEKLLIEALKKNVDDSKWKSGVFIGIKTVSNTKVGNVGQDFIEGLCGVLSIPCSFPLKENGKRSTQSPWDIKINDIKFELKTATEDVNGSFQFDHVRYHRPYDAVLCLGVTPNELYFRMWSKAEITTQKAGKLASMEKQANASFKLTKKPRVLFPITEFSQKLTEFTKKYLADNS